MFGNGIKSPLAKEAPQFFLSGRSRGWMKSAADKIKMIHPEKKSPSFLVQAAMPASNPARKNKGVPRPAVLVLSRTAARSVTVAEVIKKQTGISAYCV